MVKVFNIVLLVLIYWTRTNDRSEHAYDKRTGVLDMQSVYYGFKQFARNVLAFKNIETVSQMVQRLKKQTKKKRNKTRRLFPHKSFKGTASIF